MVTRPTPTNVRSSWATYSDPARVVRAPHHNRRSLHWVYKDQPTAIVSKPLVFYQRVSLFDRRAVRGWILGNRHGLKPWTTPSMHDVSDILVVLVRNFASPTLWEIMGEFIE